MVGTCKFSVPRIEDDLQELLITRRPAQIFWAGSAAHRPVERFVSFSWYRW